MRPSKPTMGAVACMLVALVIARHEPAWTKFLVQSVAVLAGSIALARLINRSGRR